MNYITIYDDLIKKRQRIQLSKRRDQNYVYCEKHHIIPRSWNGSNDKDNIVLLTLREHFIAHLLLEKIAEQKYGKLSQQHISMIKAITFFKTCKSNKFLKERQQLRFTSRTFEYVRKLAIEANRISNTGRKQTHETISKRLATIKRKYQHLHRHLTEETKRKISKSLTNQHISIERRQKISKSLTGTKKPPRTDEHRKKLSEARKGKYCKEQNPAYGRRWMHHPETQIKVYAKREEIDQYLANGFVFGVNDATRQKNCGKFLYDVNGKRIKFVPRNSLQ